MRRDHLSRVFLSLALLAVGACSGGGGLGLGPTTPHVRFESVEPASYQLVNVERLTTGGSDKLNRGSEAANLARQYAEQMRDEGFFAHTTPDGKTLRQRLTEAGVEFTAAAENLVKVTNSADPASYAHTLLLQQPEHRENMLDEKYELLGVGAAKRNDTVWIAQIYIKR